MNAPKRILLVEDSKKDIELALEALAEHKLANQVAVVRDGVEALDYLYRRGQFADHSNELPVLVLLDLKMPRVDGLEVLRQVRGGPQPLHLAQAHGIRIVGDVEGGLRILLDQQHGLALRSDPMDRMEYLIDDEAVRNLGVYWILVNEAPPEARSEATPA